MEIQRTVTILLPNDDDLKRTLGMFRAVQQDVSAACFNEGKPLSAVELQRAVYHDVKGTLNSQMTITALRLVAGAYASAKRNKRPAAKPFAFARAAAMFLVGKRGRDADFRKDGTLSLWTVGGRKRIGYTVPAYAQPIIAAAKEIDSLTIIERDGRLVGRVVVTLEVPEPAGVLPIGIDRGETNALVAVDTDGRELFITGVRQKVQNTKTRKTRGRLQSKLASRKAERRDTRSVRRVIKRLSRKQSRRTQDFSRVAAKRLVAWAQPGSILVLEDLRIPQQSKKTKMRKGVRRRLSLWAHGQLEAAIRQRAEMCGVAVVSVNPAFTSQDCSRCGLRGVRQKHSFSCPHCGHTQHSDSNAATNIRQRFTALRSSAGQSMPAEARTSQEVAGKPPALAGGR
jgi:IS605 OrfB family transposase